MTHDWYRYGSCVECGTAQSTDVPDYCRQCGAPILLIDVPNPLPSSHDGSGAWRYAGHLPLGAGSDWVSLGEGNTSLVQPHAIREWCETDLRLKLEHLNPSGSFKDRASAVGIAHAVERGSPTVVCASSGNAAGSTAAYAAHAGLHAIVLVPESAPSGKLAMARAHGATTLRVSGDYSVAFSIARTLAREYGWTNLTTTFVNPVAITGLKTAGYEIAENLGETPDWIAIPVGAGPLVYGIVTAFRELRTAGLATKIPRIVAVQAAGCAPIVHAFDQGAAEVEPWREVSTDVSAISDPLRGYPADGNYTLRLVRESAGIAIAVNDEQIHTAENLLAAKEGLLVEPGAATTIAAVHTLRQRETIGAGELVVGLLTGHGLKTLQADEGLRSPVIENADAAIAALSGACVGVAQ